MKVKTLSSCTGLIVLLLLTSPGLPADTKPTNKGTSFSQSEGAQNARTLSRRRPVTIEAAGDTARSWVNSWSYSTIGLDYDKDLQKFWYAHESQSTRHDDTIYLTDSTGTIYNSFAPSDTNKSWPWQLDNRTGIDIMPNGNLLLPDYNGDLSYADDNIIEITTDGFIVNAWEMDNQVGSNDCANGYTIDSIIDIAVISMTDDSIHALVTAAYDANYLYEIMLARTGTWWTPNSWRMVNIDSTESLGLENSSMGDILGVDISGDKIVLSDWHSTLVAFYDLNMTFIDTVHAVHDSSGGYNSGVCFIEETTPGLMAVTDFSSDMTGIPETGFYTNTPPEISDIADQSGYVNTVIGPVSFTIDDDLTDPSALIVTATSDNQTLIPDGNITLAGSGTDRTIELTPALDENGTATITVTVTDGQGAQANDQFDVTVIAVGSLLYVNGATGVDDVARDGSESEPFATISYAVSRATANDSIDITGTFIAEGVASDGIVIDKNLTLWGQGADQTFIQGHATDAASADRRCLTITAGTTVTLRDMTLRNGNANGGGAIKHQGDDLTLENCVVSDNASTGSPNDPNGGGIWASGPASLRNCTVSDNSSDFKGGGVYAEQGLVLEKCTLSGNSAERGAALCYYPGTQSTVKMTNCTVSGNSAVLFAGGVLCDADLAAHDAYLVNVTFAENSAGTAHPSGLYATSKNNITLDLINCIFDNTTLPNYFSDGSGTVTLNRSFTLSSDASMPITGTGNLNTTDPLLGALADNGGATQTHAPAGNSPAVDVGTFKGVPSEDQRGTFRPQALGYDIGAVERVPQAFFVNSTAGVDDAARDGSLLQPWATISYAIGRTEVGDGDVINTTGVFVADGVSGDGIVVDKSLTIMGQPLVPTVVQAHAVSAALSDRRCFTIAPGKQVNLMNMVISNGNAGSNDGGGIHNSGELTLVNCTVRNNIALNGGGIYSTEQLVLAQSTVNNNSSTANGGGIYSYYSDPLSQGGGLGALPFANLSMLNCTLSGNSAGSVSGHGGGLLLHAKSVTTLTPMSAQLTNVTLANNSCNGSGNGLYQQVETADVDSAVIQLKLKNSILANGTSNNSGSSVTGTKSALILDRDHTLCQDNTLNADGPGNLNNTDPLLDVLASNGGDTQTHALLTGSPAKNSGTTDGIQHVADQRGLPHVNGPDMGSFESQSDGVALKLALWLDGPYDAGGDTMKTLLQQNVLLPRTSPYDEDPVTVGQLPADKLVDWILVQLLSSDGSQVMASQSAFLTHDGDVVSPGGVDSLVFDGLSAGAYLVKVDHRNHVQAQSAMAVPLTIDVAVTYDFTTQNAASGSNNLKELETDVWGLPAGDLDSDGEITSADYVDWYNQSRDGISGYLSGDLELNGSVAAEDFLLWQENSRQGFTDR